MRKIFLVLLMLSLATALAFAGGGKKDKALVGYVSDSHCAAKHSKDGGEGCVKKCVEGGAKLVFVPADGEVLTVANPEKLAGHEGHKVKISGKVNAESNTIEVNTVEMASAGQ